MIGHDTFYEIRVTPSAGAEVLKFAIDLCALARMCQVRVRGCFNGTEICVEIGDEPSDVKKRWERDRRTKG